MNSTPRPSLSTTALLAIASLSLAPTSTAQVPDGWAAVSRFRVNGGATSGGLSFVDPLGSTVIDVTGLPAELTGINNTQYAAEGAGSVLIDGRTGHVLVAEHAVPGSSTDIHVLTLTGNAVAADSAYPIGTSPNEIGSVDQMAWLGDDVVFAARGHIFTSGPLAGHLLGLLRPRLGPPGTPGTVQPVALTSNPSGYPNAFAVDEEGRRGWLSMSQSSTLSNLYEIPLTGGAAPVAPIYRATIPGDVRNLVHRNGVLWVGSSGSSRLWRVDLTAAPAAVVGVSNPFGIVNAMTLDHASGDLLIADATTNQLHRRDAAGNVTSLGSVNGSPSGIALRQSLAPYGTATPGTNSYRWQLAPSPGGAPTIGNSSFSITIDSSPGVAAGLAALSLAEAPTPMSVFGFDLLIDPAQALSTASLVPSAQATVALPIPNSPGLAGLRVYVQCVFADGGSFAATRGLRITLEP